MTTLGDITRMRSKQPAFALPIIPPSSHDAAIIRRCITLAERAAGQTRPNPPVGCVITDANGKTLGEGYHRRAGTPHAEVHALAAVQRNGQSAHGATAYVSLEPCNHYGRTPPCAKALVEAGISRVVIGMVDPDPRTGGGGIARMRSHGILVDVGIENAACNTLCEGFVSRVVRKRPLGVLKWAMTLDGKIAAEDGSSKWVTGEEARSHVHAVRARMDAVIVGGCTVRRDDPRLTVRGIERDGPLAPIRVVLTRGMDLPDDRALWNTEEADTVVFTHSIHGREALVDRLMARGVHVECRPHFGPDDVMQYLYERDCLNVLWECGGQLASQAIAAGAVQKVMAFIAPKIIGGASAPSPIASPPLGDGMASALELCERSVETFGNGDLLVTGYLSS